MAKYKVYLCQTVYEATSIVVEADDEEEAEGLAYEIAVCATDDNPPDWKFIEAEGDIELMDCEPWPPVQEKEPADA